MTASQLLNYAWAEDVWPLLTPTLVASVLVALAAVCLLLLRRPEKASRPSGPGPSAWEGFAQRPRASGTENGEMPNGPNLQGTFIPSTGLIQANQLQPSKFENDNCIGWIVPLHRPTWNKALDKSCKYPYGDHFRGRKRLWEMRLQFKFKRDVDKLLRFGIELEEYVPLNAASKKLMSITVAALRKVAGSDLYHSPGDDPRKTAEPREKPVFSMPLWAFDQLIVTPEGEEPPDLTDPSFSEFGTRRADDRAAFIAEVSELKLQAGPTYTLAFWGISQFLDDIKWELTKIIPFKNIDFNLFCGAPPVHFVLYTLEDELDGEKRHLQKKKDYFFRLAFWSSKYPPSQERLQRLLPGDDAGESPINGVATKRKGWKQKLSGMVNCCAQQRPA